jgi:hypothetical protein
MQLPLVRMGQSMLEPIQKYGGAVKSEDTKKARKNQGQQLMLVHTAQLDWMTLMPHRIIEFGGLLVTLIQLLRRIEQNFS